jgi:hypothetical protein
MATVKKGILTSSPEWWKHLRQVKRVFWKGERQAARHDIGDRVDNDIEDDPRFAENRAGNPRMGRGE